MKKLYYHPEFEFRNGRFVCVHCGVVSPDGLSEHPCVIPTAAQSIYEDLRFEISVWNCRPELVCFKEEGTSRRYLDIKITSNLKKKVEDLIIKSVHDAGGAINFSGIYPLNEELEKVLYEGIKNRKILINN